jgi:hypothetical protein
VSRLRDQLAALRARYDSGAVPPGIYAVIRELENQIAWTEAKQQRSDDHDHNG